MSDQVAKIIELSERQAVALERIAAALEVANYARAFPSVVVTPLPAPYSVGDPPFIQWPTVTYVQTFGDAKIGSGMATAGFTTVDEYGTSGVMKIVPADEQTVTYGGAHG